MKMSTAYAELDLDFDLDFLQTSSGQVQAPSKLEKQKKAVLVAKRKTIATDSLIKKYYEKKEEADQIERNLFKSKEECKQICIDHRNALQKVANLELNVKELQDEKTILQRQVISAENQCKAIESHANQLQLLIKDNETKIEALTIDTQLEKNNLKDLEKNNSSLEKEKFILLEHINIIIKVALGKRKLNKEIREICKTYKNSFEDDKCSSDEDLGIDTPDHELWADGNDEQEPVVLNATGIHKDKLELKTSLDYEKKIKQELYQGRALDSIGVADHDSENSNEVISGTDTGRGSSLYSESGKSLLSPEYYIDSPFANNESNKNLPINRKQNVEIRSIATSPIIFEDETITECETNKFKKDLPELRHFATSPIHFEESVQDVMEEDDIVMLCPVESNCEDVNYNSNNVNLDPSPIVPQIVIECAEDNHSSLSFPTSKSDEESMDLEVTTILNVMKFRSDFITPIPPTPVEMIKPVIKLSPEKPKPQICLEAAKIREENIILHTNLAKLAKEVMEIKCFLKNQFNSISNNNISTCSVALPDTKKLTNSEPKLDEDFDITNDFVEDNDIVSSSAQCSDVNNTSELKEHCDTQLNSNCDNIDSLNKVSEKFSYENPLPEENHNSSPQANLNKHCDIPCRNEDNCSKKVRKKCKITKLEKLRNKLKPRNKIKLPDGSPKKKTSKITKTSPRRKCVNIVSSSVTLNDKTVYDKALAVVAEMREKQKQQAATYNKKVRKTTKKVDETETKTILYNNNEIDAKIDRTQTIDSVSDGKVSQLTNTNDIQNIECNKNLHTKSHKESPSLSSVMTRSKRKRNDSEITSIVDTDILTPSPIIVQNESVDKTPQKINSLKRCSVETSEVQQKRMLRSTTKVASDDIKLSDSSDKSNGINSTFIANCSDSDLKISTKTDHAEELKNYKDLDMFESEPLVVSETKTAIVPKNSILCKMLEKYAVKISARETRKVFVKSSTIDDICKHLEEKVEQISNLKGEESKHELDRLVDYMKSLRYNDMIMGLMKFLKEPNRKTELFNKTCSPPAPPMSKSEQVLVYVLSQMNVSLPLIDDIMKNIEYTIFKINDTPDFDVIDSLSHFYGVLCRLIRNKTRLRMFMLDAMYCISFKAVPLVKQCIEVWMHVIPLAHMGIAKSPLVVCLVYLLHFYKCTDYFNRVNDIRVILQNKYSYNMSEWNEKRILAVFKTSIMELRDNRMDTKMLKLAIIILAKRQGPAWCLKNLIKNTLIPIIESHPLPRIKLFCIDLLGPIIKPFPADMKIHIEVVMNQLLDILGTSSSQEFEEAVISSLLYMRKHNSHKVIQILLTWFPRRQISQELEALIRDYVQERPMKVWLKMISHASLV